MDKLTAGTWPHRWALLPLRLIVGYGFFAHGLAKWNRGPEKFAKLLVLVGALTPPVSAWGVSLSWTRR